MILAANISRFLDPRPGLRHWFANSMWVARLKAAPRSELEQAILRVAIPAVVMFYIGIDAVVGDPLTENEQRALWFAIGFFFFAIVLAGFVVRAKGDPKFRRLFGIFVDNAGNTIYLLIAGEAGAFVFGIYLFVTFGNGFRFGQFYLRVSQALSIVGFLVVLYASPFWSAHIPVGIGILIALDVFPDIFKTVSNVTADMAVATVLARGRRVPASAVRFGGDAGSGDPSAVALL